MYRVYNVTITNMVENEITFKAHLTNHNHHHFITQKSQPPS